MPISPVLAVFFWVLLGFTEFFVPFVLDTGRGGGSQSNVGARRRLRRQLRVEFSTALHVEGTYLPRAAEENPVNNAVMP